MSEVRYTPGKWKASTFKSAIVLDRGAIATDESADEKTVIKTNFLMGGLRTTVFLAEVFTTVGRESEAKANARLIAAAPDMYEAIRAAIDCGMVPKSSAREGGAIAYARQTHVADMLRDAIAKAEGRMVGREGIEPPTSSV